MPTLQLTFEGAEVACDLNKVDRSKLYGYVETEILDDDGKPCSSATLASDGRTVIASGGVALAYVSPNGLWRERGDLKAVDLDGNEIEAVTSTFKAPVELGPDAEAPIETLLDHNIRMVYALTPDEEAEFPPALLKSLKDGTLYQFDFSYRGGLTADTAFLITGGDDTVWMLVGKPTDISFLRFDQAGSISGDESDSHDAAEEIDFGMF